MTPGNELFAALNADNARAVRWIRSLSPAEKDRLHYMLRATSEDYRDCLRVGATAAPSINNVSRWPLAT